MMASMAFAMHDRVVAPYSLSQDEGFGHEGWRWKLPADASEATQVEEDCY